MIGFFEFSINLDHTLFVPLRMVRRSLVFRWETKILKKNKRT